MTYTAEKIADGFTFPESPRWHAGRQAFYHVDIDEGKLYELKVGAPSRLLHQFGGLISGMAFDDEDGFYVAAGKKIVHVQGALTGDGRETVFADLSDLVGFVINDMTRAANGDIFAGALNFNALAKFQDDSVPVELGSIIHVGADGTVKQEQRVVDFANAVVIPPDAGRVLMADTYGQCIRSWPLNPDGSLGEPGIWADLGDEAPDGMCLDAEGALWIASHNHAIRVGEGGEVTDEIPLPDGHVTACALGGADGRTLIITAAASIDRRIVRASLTGVIYQVRVDVPGAGLPSIYSS